MNLTKMKLGLAVVCFCLCASPLCQAQEQEDFDWVNKHFGKAFDEFFPSEDILKSSLSYRSYKDLHTDQLEYSFAFRKSFQEPKLTIIYRIADQKSLYDQIMVLHRKKPAESIENIKKLLRVKERQYIDKDCPAIKKQYDEFYKLNLLMLSDTDRANQAKGIETIIIHPRVHIFKAEISGGSLEMVFVDSDHPFVKWAEQTMYDLEKCVPQSSALIQPQINK
jgi:hypothetical protein